MLRSRRNFGLVWSVNKFSCFRAKGVRRQMSNSVRFPWAFECLESECWDRTRKKLTALVGNWGEGRNLGITLPSEWDGPAHAARPIGRADLRLAARPIGPAHLGQSRIFRPIRASKIFSPGRFLFLGRAGPKNWWAGPGRDPSGPGRATCFGVLSHSAYPQRTFVGYNGRVQCRVQSSCPHDIHIFCAFSRR